MKKIKTTDGRIRRLPDKIADALIKNRGATEIKRGRPIVKELPKKVVAKEDKTVIQTKEDKQIKKRSTK